MQVALKSQKRPSKLRAVRLLTGFVPTLVRKMTSKKMCAASRADPRRTARMGCALSSLPARFSQADALLEGPVQESAADIPEMFTEQPTAEEQMAIQRAKRKLSKKVAAAELQRPNSPPRGMTDADCHLEPAGDAQPAGAQTVGDPEPPAPVAGPSVPWRRRKLLRPARPRSATFAGRKRNAANQSLLDDLEDMFIEMVRRAHSLPSNLSHHFQRAFYQHCAGRADLDTAVQEFPDEHELFEGPELEEPAPAFVKANQRGKMLKRPASCEPVKKPAAKVKA